MPPNRAALVPILPSSDLERSLAYYRYLGFELLEHVADYARLSWHDAELHLYPQPTINPTANSAGCYLQVPDPHALRDTWSGDGVNCIDCPGTTIPPHFGQTVFAIIDPDGNTLRIGRLSPPPGALSPR